MKSSVSNVFKKIILFLLVVSNYILIFILSVQITSRINNKLERNIKGASKTRIYLSNIIQNNSNHSNLKFFYEPKPNNIESISEKWLKNVIKYTINSDSLNERFNYDLQKNNKNFRIITIGDSFTFGQYVDTENNFSEKLENFLSNLSCSRYSKYEVINLGVYGYDLEYSVERFSKRGIKYNPDLVIWLINDWNIFGIHEIFEPYKEKLRAESISVKNDKTEEFEIIEKTINELKNDYGDNYYYDYQKRVLNRMKNIYNGRVIIFSFMNKIMGKPKKLIDFMKLNPNYTFLDDIHPSTDPKYLHIDGHPNELGHLFIAETLFRYIKENILTRCNAQ